MVNDAIKSCMPCQVATKLQQRAPLKTSTLPERPWQELSIDFYSLPTGEELLVMIDDYSRYPVVAIVSSTSFLVVKSKIEHIYSEK